MKVGRLTPPISGLIQSSFCCVGGTCFATKGKPPGAATKGKPPGAGCYGLRCEGRRLARCRARPSGVRRAALLGATLQGRLPQARRSRHPRRCLHWALLLLLLLLPLLLLPVQGLGTRGHMCVYPTGHGSRHAPRSGDPQGVPGAAGGAAPAGHGPTADAAAAAALEQAHTGPAQAAQLQGRPS